MEWYLIWFLTIQPLHGDIWDEPIMRQHVESEAECLHRAKVKELRLEKVLGKYWQYGMNMGYRQFGGKAIGYTVGCIKRYPYTGGYVRPDDPLYQIPHRPK